MVRYSNFSLIMGSGDPGETEMLVRHARFATYEECMRITAMTGPEAFEESDLDRPVDAEKDTVHIFGFCLPSLEAEKQLQGTMKDNAPMDSPSSELRDQYKRYDI